MQENAPAMNSNFPELLPHQKEAVDFFVKRSSIPLLLDTGLGKTATSLEILKTKNCKRVLCVIPKSITDQWVAEIAKFTDYTSVVAIGNRTKRIENIRADVNIVLINFEGVRICFDEIKALAKVGYFDCLLIDELSRVRRYSKQTRCLQEIARFFPVRIGLSGLLIAENMIDAFNPYKILDLGRTFGTDFFAFLEKYFTETVDDTGTYRKYTATEYGQKMIPALVKRTAFIRTAEQVSVLPPSVFSTRKVSLSIEQDAFLKTLEKEWKAKFPGSLTEEFYNYTIQLMQKAMQCCSGFVYKEDDSTFWFDYNPKLQELNAILEELGKSHFIVWCNYKAEKLLITQFLEKQGKTVCPSETPQDFNTGKYDAYIGTFSRDAQGHSFKIAKTAIFFSRPTSYEKFYQSLGRNRRVDSESALINYIIISSKHKTEFLNDLALKKKKDLADLLRETKMKDIWKN